MSGRCKEHNEERAGTCTWCSITICSSCQLLADGRKLCGECFEKLERQGVLGTKKKSQGVIRNKDPKLTEEDVKERRALLQKRPVQKPRIRNIPDWPELK